MVAEACLPFGSALDTCWVTVGQGGGGLSQGGKSKDELIENFLYAKA